MQDKKQLLGQVFGYGSFREGQEEIIDALLAGRDVLGIMPTGAGKSICYQLPALLLEGITLVVSPLVSLMKDQVGALVQAGVPAAYLNSSLSAGQFSLALKRACEGRYKIIYVAPERLETASFLSFARAADISLVTVDEAHCVSQWGQDFRPSYLGIGRFIEGLQKRPVLAAFTATATSEVKQDILALLGLESPLQRVTGFDRGNLFFEVRRPANKMAELSRVLQSRGEQSGIIYCATRKGVEAVCDALCARGLAATRYHAGLPDGERQANQDAFLHDQKTIMVATNAFGMGIDKSNVGYVVHYNMPKNIESYYQEAGRAGRDGAPADCILLYAPEDVRTARFLIQHSRDSSTLPPAQQEATLANDLALLDKMSFYATTTGCLRAYILRYFGEESAEACGHCSNCKTEYAEVDIAPATAAILALVAELDTRRRSFGKGMLVDVLRGSGKERIRSLGLDRLSGYGSLRTMDATRLGTIFDYLVYSGALAISQGEYPVVTLTRDSDGFLDGGPLLLRMAKTGQKTARTLEDMGLDAALFSLLREKRMELAKRSGIPAYVIFTDAALRDMCAKRPTTPDEFLQVSGVGAAKLERYGEEFLAVLATYAEEKTE